MIGLVVLIPILVLLIWLFSVRPFCRKNGKGYTPGANIGATFWIDWQEAGEIAKRKGDRKMIMICRLLLGLQIAWVLVLILAVVKGG